MLFDRYWVYYALLIRSRLMALCFDWLVVDWLITCVRQITAADFVGPKADEFLLKVKQASAEPPWNMEPPSVVYSIPLHIFH